MDTRDLETCPRTYIWSFFKYVTYWRFQGHLSTFQKMGSLRKSKFSQWRSNHLGPYWFMWLWGVGWGWLGVPSTHMHMHVHACMHTHTHAYIVNMIIPHKWPPPLGNPWEFPMMSYTHVHMHACTCLYMCVGGTLPPPYTPIHPTAMGEPPESVKFNSTWTNWDISILSEDLKSVETPHPLVDVWFCRWVGQWVNGWGQVKSLKISINLDLIEIIQFCLKIYNL